MLGGVEVGVVRIINSIVDPVSMQKAIEVKRCLEWCSVHLCGAKTGIGGDARLCLSTADLDDV